jgi:integrase
LSSAVAIWPPAVSAESTVAALLAPYLDWLSEQGMAAHTVSSSRLDLLQLTRFVGRQPLREIALEDLRAFFLWLARQQGNSVSSLRRKTSTVKRFFRQLQADGVLDVDPAAGLLYPALATTPTHPLTTDEVGAIVLAAVNPVWQVLVLCLVDCGLKRDEVVALRWEDIEIDGHGVGRSDGLLHVRHRRATRRVRQRTLGLTARLQAALFAVQAETQPDDGSVLGISARGIDFVVETCARRAGVRPDQKITPQMLRDAYGHARVRAFREREAALGQSDGQRAQARATHNSLLLRELGLSPTSAVADRYRAMVERLEPDRSKEVDLDDT